MERGKSSKRYREVAGQVGAEKQYTLEEAVSLARRLATARFDETMEISLKLGIDPRKTDQQVRGTVALPHGTGKKVRVLVFARGATEEEAREAGADFVGFDELVEKIKGGWTEFDVAVTTPDLMREVARLGKILGPRGLMPSPKAGTVTRDIGSTVREVKAGKIEFRCDKQANVQVPFGKASFDEKKLVENGLVVVNAILKGKPAGAKGQYIKKCCISSTMGPGIEIDMKAVTDAIRGKR